jgi:hypothetical protein
MERTFTLEEIENITYDAMKHVGYTSIQSHRDWFENWKSSLPTEYVIESTYDSWEEVLWALRNDKINKDIIFIHREKRWKLYWERVKSLYDEYGKDICLKPDILSPSWDLNGSIQLIEK